MSAVLALPSSTALPRALDPAALQAIAEKVRQASSLLCLAHGGIEEGPAADAVAVADDLLAAVASMAEDLALTTTTVPSAVSKLAPRRR